MYIGWRFGTEEFEGRGGDQRWLLGSAHNRLILKIDHLGDPQRVQHFLDEQ